VDRLSRKVREGIGATLRSIRSGVRLEEVTTPSLEALRKYSQAERLADQGRFEDAKALLDEALRLDSNFAMAWRKRGVVLGNTSSDPAAEIAAVQRAYDLRDRLPERERLIATAYFHAAVVRDRKAEINAYQELLQRWPDDLTALNNISIGYSREGRFREAEESARHGLELSPTDGALWSNLIAFQARQGKFEHADSSLRRWGELSPDVGSRQETAASLGWAKGDHVIVATYADSTIRSDLPSLQAFGRSQRAAVALLQGRLEEATRFAREVEELNARRGASRYPLVAYQARMVNTLGRGAEAAVHHLDSALTRFPLGSVAPLNRDYAQLAGEYARAGAVSRAEALMREYEREIPEILRNTPQRFNAEGLIAQARGDHAGAIAAFRTSREREGCWVCRLYEIGQSFDALQQLDSVLATYETLLATNEPDPHGRDFALPGVYRRLGELYEGKGDVKKALEFYGKFVDLWKNADPSLQPRVTEVRRRRAELTAKER
jgi:tetratricopeptide (TPR) repeat protein